MFPSLRKHLYNNKILLTVVHNFLISQIKMEEEQNMASTPPELRRSAEEAANDLLPAKSKKVYEATYNGFVEWKKGHKTSSSSETVLLAYFNELSRKYKPTSLWSTYSMLKSTMKIKEKIDISRYAQLTALLKQKSVGFKSKKSKVLRSEEINKFLTEAPDAVYLATKVFIQTKFIYL